MARQRQARWWQSASPLLGVMLLISSCSIERYQKPEEILYTGIKSIQIEGETEGVEAQRALSAVEEQIAYAPNGALMGSSSVRLPNPLFRPWLFLRYEQSKSWVGRMLHRMGKKPIWVQEVNPSLRAKVAERILGEHGYLSARVHSTTLREGRDSLEAKVAYHIELGKPYLLDSVEHLPQWHITEAHSFAHRKYSPLQRGVRFTHQALLDDRSRASQYLREHGYYYFTPEYIRYDADTLQTPGAVQLRAHLAEGLGADVLRQWRVGAVRVRFVEASESEMSLTSERLDIAPAISAHYSGAMPLRRRVLNRLLRLRPDSLYRASLEERTQRGLMGIGAFSAVELFYTPRAEEGQDSLERKEGIVDMDILLRYDKPWSVNLSSRFMHKTTDFWGPGLSLSLSKSNLLGGGETLTLSAAGSYEWQVGQNPFNRSGNALNSYSFSLDASLSFPTLLLPRLSGRYYRYATSTSVRLGTQTLKRSGYYGLNTMSMGLSYEWSPQTGTTHSLSPLSLSYSSLGETTAEFEQVLNDNPSLRLSLMSQLIPQMSYVYTRDRRVGRGQAHRLWLRVGLSEAGNLIKGIQRLGGKPYSETQRILGVPFAQFVKTFGELRYTHAFSRTNSLAMRLGVGLIYSYGNMLRAPYMEQFFVGGANSIRAFTVRSLGPGSFRPRTEQNYSFMDRVGESKIELNAEWRMRFVGALEGAVFVDAGNVWLLRRDVDRVGASLGEIGGLGNLLKQIAVGTGFGLRYDMDYLLIRFDVGIGLHLPYETERRGWYNIPRWRDGFGLHLAIGYPF